MTYKGILNYLIDCGLIITFLLSFITGIVKFPEWTRFFGDVFLLIPASTLSKIHDYSGIVMGLLVLSHLVLHWRWIVAMQNRPSGERNHSLPSSRLCDRLDFFSCPLLRYSATGTSFPFSFDSISRFIISTTLFTMPLTLIFSRGSFLKYSASVLVLNCAP